MIPPEYDSPTWPPVLRADLAAKAERAGKPVPAVDPEHIKILWTLHLEKEAERARLGVTGLGAVCGGGPVENPLGPGADLTAAGERFTWLWFLFDFSQKHWPEHFPAILKSPPSEKAFSAIASIPMEYTGLSRTGFPFDADEFLRQISEAA
jgi:hypothetical protein